MLNVIMMNIVMLNVVMQNVVMLNVIMLGVKEPYIYENESHTDGEQTDKWMERKTNHISNIHIEMYIHTD
jgi:hypothetical protein